MEIQVGPGSTMKKIMYLEIYLAVSKLVYFPRLIFQLIILDSFWHFFYDFTFLFNFNLLLNQVSDTFWSVFVWYIS